MTDTATPIVTCPRCGAPRTNRNAARFCEFCGHEMPAATTTAPSGLAPHAEAPARRFERLEAHPDLPALLAKRPSSAGTMALGLGSLIPAVLVLVMGVVALNAFRSHSGPFESATPAWATIFPYVFIGIGVLLVARVLGRTTRFAAADLEARPGLVVDERTQVRGGGDGPSSTSYYVTIESKDGRRTEYSASGTIAGRVTAGDIGVAYVRADQLLEFERVVI